MAKIKGLCGNIGDCSKAQNRELQVINSADLFVCQECYEPLDPIVEQPDNSKKYYIIGGGILILIILLGLGYILMNGNFSSKDTSRTKDKVETEEVFEDEILIDEELSDEDEVLIEEETPIEEEVVLIEKDSTQNETPIENEAVEITGDIDYDTLIEEEKKENAAKPVANEEATNVITYDDDVYDLGYATWSGRLDNGKPSGNAQMTFKKRRLIESRDSKSRFAEAGDYIIGTYKNGHLIHGRWYKKNGNIETITIGEAASDEE